MYHDLKQYKCIFAAKKGDKTMYYVPLGFFGNLIMTVIIIACIVASVKDNAGASDLRESRMRYEDAERKARRRSERLGTNYETERAKAMKEAFPDNED